MSGSQQPNSCTRVAKREACDKCHDIKSRCFKPSGSRVCNRCERFALACTHSAPLRIGRPKGSGNGKSTSSKKRPAEDNEWQMPSGRDQKSQTPSETQTQGMEVEHTWTGIDEEFDFDISTYFEADPQQNTIFGTPMQLQPHSAPIDRQQTAASDQSSPGSLDTSGLIPSSKTSIDFAEHKLVDQEASLIPNRLGQSLSGHTPGETKSNRYMYKLLELQLTLYHLSECFVVTWSQKPGQEEPVNQNAFSSNSTNIDEAFTATESLINIIHELCPPTPASGDLLDECLEYNPTKLGSTGLCDNPTMLSIMSCYLRILNIYKNFANTLSTDITPSTNSAFTSPPHNTSSNSHNTSPAISEVPSLNLGRFNLSSSPEMNIGLMVHFILEMVERLQTAVELCTSTARNNTAGLIDPSQAEMSSSRYYHVPRAGDRGAKIASSTVLAIQEVFKSMLSDLGTREKELTEILHEVKNQLRRISVTRSGY